MSTFIKTLIALALVGIYWALGGFDPANQRSHGKLHSAIFAVYLAGMLCALSEGDSEQSLRPVFIIVGLILMILAFCAMLATKSERHQRAFASQALNLGRETSPFLAGVMGVPIPDAEEAGGFETSSSVFIGQLLSGPRWRASRAQAKTLMRTFYHHELSPPSASST